MQVKCYIVYATFPDKLEAEKISKVIIKNKFAACVNIMPPVTSMFTWEKEIQTSVEIPCIFKTTADAYPQLEKVIRELHSYKTPCIVALPVVNGLPGFLDWISGETK